MSYIKSNKDYNCVNLMFLMDFFQVIGITPHIYMKHYSNTEKQQSASIIFRTQLKNDDMMLSKVKTIFNNLGFQLSICFLNKDEYSPEKEKNYIMKITQEENTDRIKFNNKAFDQSKNLAFIEKMLIGEGSTKNDISNKMNMSSSSVYTWFWNDDIPVSRIFQIKEIYNKEIQFTITPLKKEN